MINSISIHKGAKRLDCKNSPKAVDKMIQSWMDRLYHVLKQWDASATSGPSLHASLCCLLVTRGMHKAIDTYPKQEENDPQDSMCCIQTGVTIDGSVWSG